MALVVPDLLERPATKLVPVTFAAFIAGEFVPGEFVLLRAGLAVGTPVAGAFVSGANVGNSGIVTRASGLIRKTVLTS